MKDGGFRMWDVGFRIGHMAAASLGYYASLSFVVIVGRERGTRQQALAGC